MNHMIYALKKQGTHFRRLTWTLILVQIVALAFFSLVGRFDSDETNSILTNLTGVMGLASTVTTVVAMIYNTLIQNRLVLKDYIGKTRESTYLLPDGRVHIFVSSLLSLVVHYFLRLFFVLLITNTIFYGIGFFLHFQSLSFVAYLVKAFLILSLMAFSSLVMLLLAMLAGQISQSSSASIITTILLVSTLGNVLALSYQLSPVLLVLLIVLCLFLFGILLFVLSHRIKYDDVIDHVRRKNK